MFHVIVLLYFCHFYQTGGSCVRLFAGSLGDVFSAAILLTITPGPDLAFILGQTLSNGRRGGFFAMFGIWTGAFVHVFMAAVGLSAVIATSAVAFSVVKWAGALYILWLGIMALRSRGSSFVSDEQNGTSGFQPLQIYQQGALVAALNPKVAIFFLAFLPQFVVEGAGATWAQLFLHGSLIIFVATLIEPPLVLAGAWVGGVLQRNKSVGLWLDRGLGALFITLGVRLALTRQ